MQDCGEAALVQVPAYLPTSVSAASHIGKDAAHQKLDICQPYFVVIETGISASNHGCLAAHQDPQRCC